MIGHVVSVSSGTASAFVWHLAIEEHGVENVVGLFADVNGEDADNYRFLAEVQAKLGGRLVTLDNDGRTIWDSMREQRFLANTRVDTCSKFLKREPLLAWSQENAPGATVYLGYDWTEANKRMARPVSEYETAGFIVRCPMVELLLDKADAIAWCWSVGIAPPALTREGYPHANCRGGCVKSGAKQFKRLLRERPADFAWWEEGERGMREFLGADVSILRDRRGGTTKPLTLERLRQLTNGQPGLFDDDDRSACGCFTVAP
jgi:3'-phosphoadenosine 5'-phosphosulfate sulfotransferase (PAPS reductase)/FAD synthetase